MDAASAEQGKEEEENESDERQAKRPKGTPAPHEEASATAGVSSEQSVTVEAPPRSASKLYAFRHGEPNARESIPNISTVLNQAMWPFRHEL